MSRTTLGAYHEAASALTPPAVSQFLASHSWELEAQQPHIKEIWRLTGTSGSHPARIMLPLATGYVDFQRRFQDALESLGHIHDWDAYELQERITSTRADLFFVRLDQPMTDGTIPFHQAEKTLEALYKMLKAAATTAADPSHSHRGRRPAAVSDFLGEDVRLGHTKRGSFVFTVVTRLGDAPIDSPVRADEPLGPAFPRHVMTTLARGLETTQRLARKWDGRVLEAPGELGLSAALVESVEDLAQPDYLRSLDLSFEWAAAEPRPDVGLTTIVLDRDIMVGLPGVRERLVRQEEPPRRETLVGLVKGLAREDSAYGEEETATVTLATEVGGKARSVHMTLTGDDHDWAIVAYRQKLPFTVTGDLSFERRAWRLTGNIQVDTGFLRHRVGPLAHGEQTNTEEPPSSSTPAP